MSFPFLLHFNFLLNPLHLLLVPLKLVQQLNCVPNVTFQLLILGNEVLSLVGGHIELQRADAHAVQSRSRGSQRRFQRIIGILTLEIVILKSNLLLKFIIFF